MTISSKLPLLYRTSVHMLRPVLLNREFTHLIYFCKVVPPGDPKSLYSDWFSPICTPPDVGKSPTANHSSGLYQFVTKHALRGKKLARVA